jgi:hypothetical protein
MFPLTSQSHLNKEAVSRAQGGPNGILIRETWSERTALKSPGQMRLGPSAMVVREVPATAKLTRNSGQTIGQSQRPKTPGYFDEIEHAHCRPPVIIVGSNRMSRCSQRPRAHTSCIVRNDSRSTPQSLVITRQIPDGYSHHWPAARAGNATYVRETFRHPKCRPTEKHGVVLSGPSEAVRARKR